MKKKKQLEDLENDRYGLFMTQNSFDLDVFYGRRRKFINSMVKLNQKIRNS